MKKIQKCISRTLRAANHLQPNPPPQDILPNIDKILSASSIWSLYFSLFTPSPTTLPLFYPSPITLTSFLTNSILPLLLHSFLNLCGLHIACCKFHSTAQSIFPQLSTKNKIYLTLPPVKFYEYQCFYPKKNVKLKQKDTVVYHYRCSFTRAHIELYTVKKCQRFSNQLNYSQPGRVWLMTSQLGTEKSPTFFYSVYLILTSLLPIRERGGTVVL